MQSAQNISMSATPDQLVQIGTLALPGSGVMVEVEWNNHEASQVTPQATLDTAR